jgi:phosphoribosylanthranilate isomerase
MKVKICGIQAYEDAKQAIDAGADYLGFIFVKDSNHSIDKKNAKEIIKKVKGKVLVVGVFRNNTLEEVNSLCKELEFDFVQLHGEEDVEYCEKVNSSVIKVFSLKFDFPVEETIKRMKDYPAKHYLIDRLEPGIGEPLSLRNASEISKNFSLFFAGGLTPKTVSDVVKQVKPFAVDVISGVKTNDEFDFNKMKQFINNAKGVNI